MRPIGERYQVAMVRTYVHRPSKIAGRYRLSETVTAGIGQLKKSFGRRFRYSQCPLRHSDLF